MTEKEKPITADQMQSDKANDAPPLSPEAKRALHEAAERRKAAQKQHDPKELGGRGGEDPVRYGDWEIKGRAIDF